MKSTRVLASLAAAGLGVLLAACPPDTEGGDDAATSDSATSDAGAIDSSGPDATVPDTALPDSAGPDAATVPDSATCDAAGPEGGVTECLCRADHEHCATLNGSCLAGVCHEVGSCDQAICNTGGPSFVIPDTNQRACKTYSISFPMYCTAFPCNADGSPDFCGQDAQYGWDTTHQSSERYTRDTSTTSQPVVTDNVTGLVWQGCAAGLSGDACDTGNDYDIHWAAAKTYCADLTWGGHSDWMLPDRYQLHSIADYGPNRLSIDVTAFPATPLAWFWSSSSYAGSAVYAWRVNFDRGSVYDDGKGYAHRVRCLRAGQSTTAARFARSSPVADQSVVADSVTGLVWQGCAAGLSGDACDTGSVETRDWQQALAYCEGLSWGGHSDWRLPNVGELDSLVDDRRYEPSIDVTAFPATPSVPFWSSSSLSVHAPNQRNAWAVYFANGLVGNDNMNVTGLVRCVRSGP